MAQEGGLLGASEHQHESYSRTASWGWMWLSEGVVDENCVPLFPLTSMHPVGVSAAPRVKRRLLRLQKMITQPLNKIVTVY